MFPFVIPWDDAVPDTATDVSFLNAMPAGKNGRIVTKYGHFVEEQTGRRVRFFGVNLTGKAAFPSHADADRVAAHLAKMGINIVRFHHLQNNWDKDGGFIWKSDKIWLEIDPNQLDKLDYLVAALKKKGIYSNLNLQTTRNYLPEMGFPASVKQLTDYAKRVDKFDRRMIELQMKYAKDLLDRKNKYTGLAYKDDPAVAVIEINNENSLVGAPWEPTVTGLANLPEPFLGELVSLWNDWLSKRYGTDAKLETAWQGSTAPSTINRLSDRNQWTYEAQGASLADLSQTPVSGAAPAVEIRVQRVDGVNWHVQAHLKGLNLKNGVDYTLSFRAKSNEARKMLVYSSLDQPDWHNTGLSNSLDLGTEWRTVTTSFTQGQGVDQHNRIAFMLGDQPGTVSMDSLRLTEGSAGGGLKAGQSLTSHNVTFSSDATRMQRDDFTHFLADTERNYGDEMRKYLTQTLGFRCNIIDTQVAWGGLTSLGREAPSSFADNHAYYAHPTFPKAAWSETDWLIDNTPMVKNMDTGFGELGNLAWARIDGKPYSVSEYNHPAPNDFQAECLPLLSTFAALQDWDILYLFDYGRYGEGEDASRIQGFFPVGSNPAKKAFFPSAALIFRNSLVFSAPSRATLELPPEPWKLATSAGAAWAGVGTTPNLYDTRVSIEAADVKKPQVVKSGFVTDLRSSIKAERRPTGVVYQADSPSVKAIIGFVGGQAVTMNDFIASFPAFGNKFAAVTLTATDGRPLPSTSRALLTMVGRVENTGMIWNEARSSVNKNWGSAPTVAEGIPAILSLKTDSPRKVYALDGNGNRKATVPSTYREGQLRFLTGDKYHTVWYEITKPTP